MMCKRPYCKVPTGITEFQRLSPENRAAATPFPCGRCLPCRINKSRIWVHRILLELRSHGDAVFVTLTYNDEAIPRDWSLDKKDIQLFIKRLRKRFYPEKIRYFMVGEYSKDGRPHYHGVLYGVGRLDDSIVSRSWDRGFIFLGDVTMASAQYVSGYVIKDMMHPECKELNGKKPEFKLCSQGLGKGAVLEVARQLKENKHFDEKYITEFKYGKRKVLPLGRYLTSALNNALGTSKEVIADSLWQYQEEIFNKHMGKEKFYWDSIVDEDSARRLAQEKRKKIYRKKEKL